MQRLLCAHYLMWDYAHQQYNCKKLLQEIDFAHCQ